MTNPSVEGKDTKTMDQSAQEGVALSSFIGQRRIRQRLEEIVAAAKQTNNILFHLLLCGAADSGKTTLAMTIAREMGVNVKLVGATTLEEMDDFYGLLTTLEEGNFLLIESLDNVELSIRHLNRSDARARSLWGSRDGQPIQRPSLKVPSTLEP
jgi:holliday junction DNA helicase RuvB